MTPRQRRARQARWYPTLTGALARRDILDVYHNIAAHIRWVPEMNKFGVFPYATYV